MIGPDVILIGPNFSLSVFFLSFRPDLDNIRLLKEFPGDMKREK